MLGNSIGTVMHHKNGASLLSFLGSVITPNVVRAIYCSDVIIIWKISSKIYFLSRSIIQK